MKKVYIALGIVIVICSLILMFHFNKKPQENWIAGYKENTPFITQGYDHEQDGFTDRELCLNYLKKIGETENIRGLCRLNCVPSGEHDMDCEKFVEYVSPWKDLDTKSVTE